MATTTVAATGKAAGTASGGGGDGHMKGLILSGGKGSRLRPFTYTNAKQLVPIANKPVLFYAIEQLVEAGVTEIGIIVGDTAEQVKGAVGDGSQFGAKVTFIQQDVPLGIAHAVGTAHGFLGESPFCLYLGDNFVLGGIKSYVDSFLSTGANSQILLHPVENPQAFGIAQFVDGKVAKIVEKPQDPPTNLAVIGVYMLDRNVFDVIAHLQPSGRGELEITDALQGLIDRGLRVDAEVMDRYWIDTGKMDDILNANRMVLGTIEHSVEGEVDERSLVYEPVVLEPGVKVVNSVLRGPLIVGRDTQIIDSYIGPCTAIDRNCRIKGCRIEDSVVMDTTSIEEIHWPIVKSLIGRNVELRGAAGVGSGYSLTLGDHSRIEMPDG
ncbi:MAG TPA: glucose-1-phosphate thymidylyltransferase [Dehalococcoidia bacterium]|nr:glucose-1-phosphate thymidylyltransferase [Dehalococcoidia bacterium]